MSNDIFSRYGFTENEFATPERKTFDVSAIRDNAVIFFYGPVPKKFGTTALYSRAYNFDLGRFSQNAPRVINSIVDSHGGNVASLGAGIDPYQQFTYTQKKGMTIEGEILSDNWTFMLTFTGKSNRIRSDHLLVTSAISGLDRTIYTGVCSEEPFLMVNGKQVLNDKCVLEILHKTKTAINTESGRQGTSYSLQNKSSDWVFSPDLYGVVSSRTFAGNSNSDDVNHLLTPAKIGLGIREDQGTFYTVPGISTEIKPDRKVVTSEIADDPKEHLAAVTRGIGDFMKQREHSRSIFGDTDFAPAHDELANDADYTSDQLSSALHLPTGGTYTKEDLDLTTHVTLGKLDKSFDLDVHSHTFDPASEYDSDSYSDGLINKLSYELGTIVPIVLNRLGISNIVFAYSSEDVSNGRVNERFRVSRIGFIYNISPQEGGKLRNLVEMELRNGILRKIRSVLGGDYHVTCRANIADITTIRLNPIGHGVRNTKDYVVPNILGGLVSATIGNTMDSNHSTQRLCELVETFAAQTDPDMAEFDRRGGSFEPQRDVDQWDAGGFTPSPEPLWEDSTANQNYGHVTPKPEVPQGSPQMPSLNETGANKGSKRNWDGF